MTPTSPTPDQVPVDQGMPPRQMPFVPGPAQRQWARTNDPNVFVFMLDTPEHRCVTFWTREDLEGWRNVLGELLGNSLTVAAGGLEGLPSVEDLLKP